MSVIVRNNQMEGLAKASQPTNAVRQSEFQGFQDKGVQLMASKLQDGVFGGQAAIIEVQLQDMNGKLVEEDFFFRAMVEENEFSATTKPDSVDGETGTTSKVFFEGALTTFKGTNGVARIEVTQAVSSNGDESYKLRTGPPPLSARLGHYETLTSFQITS